MYVPEGQKIPDLGQVVSAPAPCGVFLPRLTSILDPEPARPAGSRNATGPGLSDVEASAEAVFQSQPCERYGARLGSPTAAIPAAAQCWNRPSKPAVDVRCDGMPVVGKGC